MFKAKPAKTQYLRKISIKADKEGKSRPFAIFEYISQSALQPLHDSAYRALRSLEWDCTFDQNKGFRDVLYGGHSYFASFDLTSATDRFPIKLQEMMLSHLIGSDKAAAWVRIMTDYEFKVPKGAPVKFNTGQPLGAKSSWAVFSLAHHMVVHYCAMLLEQERPQYRLLGDDIVIMNEDLANKYREVMTTLGVSISPTKTHISNKLFEFAKRFGYSGVEITQFPITAIYQNLGFYPMIAAVLSVTAPERGFTPLFIHSSTPSHLEELLSIKLSNCPRLLKSVLSKARLIALLPSRYKPYMVGVSDMLNIGLAANMPYLTLEQIEGALKNAVRTVKEREIDKLVNKTAKWNMAVQSMLSQMLFTPVWGLVTRPHRIYIPVISALDNSKDLCEEALKVLQADMSVQEFMAALDEHPIRPTPTLQGLVPVRPKEVVIRSRSAILKPFLNELKKIRPPTEG